MSSRPSVRRVLSWRLGTSLESPLSLFKNDIIPDFSVRIETIWYVLYWKRTRYVFKCAIFNQVFNLVVEVKLGENC